MIGHVGNDQWRGSVTLEFIGDSARSPKAWDELGQDDDRDVLASDDFANSANTLLDGKGESDGAFGYPLRATSILFEVPDSQAVDEEREPTSKESDAPPTMWLEDALTNG